MSRARWRGRGLEPADVAWPVGVGPWGAEGGAAPAQLPRGVGSLLLDSSHPSPWLPSSLRAGVPS